MPHGWVFSFQLDYSCRLKSVSATVGKRVKYWTPFQTSTIIRILDINESNYLAIIAFLDEFMIENDRYGFKLERKCDGKVFLSIVSQKLENWLLSWQGVILIINIILRALHGFPRKPGHVRKVKTHLVSYLHRDHKTCCLFIGLLGLYSANVTRVRKTLVASSVFLKLVRP